MNKFLCSVLSLFMMSMLIGCSKYDDGPISSKLDELDHRVDTIELTIEMMNSDVVSIMAILNAVNNDLSIVSVETHPDGYIIVMNDGSKIDLHNGRTGKDGAAGKDGKDGANGKDGADGATPNIGVQKEGDMYYWTIIVRGVTSFILDKDGNKIPAMGRDGKDGLDGKDGGSGIVDAVKILIRAESDGTLQISYDNGMTWQYVYDVVGNIVNVSGVYGTSTVTDFYIDGDYYVFVLSDGTSIRLKSCE